MPKGGLKGGLDIDTSYKPSILELRFGNLLRYTVVGVAVSFVTAGFSWIMSLIGAQVPGFSDLVGLPANFAQKPLSIFGARAEWASGAVAFLYQVAAFLVVVALLGAVYSVLFYHTEKHVPAMIE